MGDMAALWAALLITHHKCLLAVEALVVLAYVATKLGWPAGPGGSRPKADARITQFASDLQTMEIGLLSPLCAAINPDHGKAADYLRTRLLANIDYAIKRHDWYEEQRARVLTTTTTLLGSALAFVTLVIGSASTSVATQYGLAGLLVIAITSLAHIYKLYNDQLDADPPYRLISDIRFWYFRYNLPDRSGKVRPRDTLTLAREVGAERERFVARLCEQLGPQTDMSRIVREDIEQIFILQVLQRYKHESLTRMRWALTWFVLFACVQVAVVVGQKIFFS